MRRDLVVEYKHPIRPLVLGASRRPFADGSSYADITWTEDLRSDGEPWWAHARCNDGSGGLVEVFFSGELNDIARAKRLCLSCSALIPCLEGALERCEPWGVWGGQLFLDGKIVATKRRRGRPPKVPRPGDQLPEVPLPEHLHAEPVAGGTAAEPSLRPHGETLGQTSSTQQPRQPRREFPRLASGPVRWASTPAPPTTRVRSQPARSTPDQQQRPRLRRDGVTSSTPSGMPRGRTST
jgi:WhiB family transcriptional regulator, redox-sensing transcriptional regulator